MSNLPTPTLHPPSPQRIAGSLASVINAIQELLSTEPHKALELRPTLLEFYAHPISALILGLPSQAPAPPSLPQNTQQQLDKITAAISTLSKTVEGLKPPHSIKPLPPSTAPPNTKAPQQGKGTTAATLNTYASKAAAQARPSLVYSAGGAKFKSEPRPEPSGICHMLNISLVKTQYNQVQFAATRWTAKGNLVLTASHNTTQQQLHQSSAFIKKLMNDFLNATAPTTIRSNTKWSKILINSVPTGAAEGRAPYTPSQCHAALQATNPQYAQLSVTQLPTWVRAPDTFAAHSHSSLVFSFEDPDGTQEKTFLAARQLYIFGTVATTKKWKTSPPKAKTTAQHTTAAETQQQGESDPQTTADSEPTNRTHTQQGTALAALPQQQHLRRGRSKQAQPA